MPSRLVSLVVVLPVARLELLRMVYPTSLRPLTALLVRPMVDLAKLPPFIQNRGPSEPVTVCSRPTRPPANVTGTLPYSLHNYISTVIGVARVARCFIV